MNKTLFTLGLAAVASLFFVSCDCGKKADTRIIPAENFDTTINGKQVSLYTLQNSQGMVAQLTNYGARLVDLWVKDKQGSFQDVVWGYDSIQGYLNSTDLYCGPIVGRYGNRIGKGKFTLDGTEYTLTLNNNGNQLHGGPGGFECRVWDAVQFKTPEGNDAVKMTYVSPAGEEGYPGTLTTEVTYSLNENNELVIEYNATTDAPTILNPTNHSYFNLHGTSAQSTNSHVLQINANEYTPTDSLLIPTGEIASIEGTPLDFRTPTEIGLRINNDFEALKFGAGYDHNYIIAKDSVFGVSAVVYEPATGIVMTVSSDQPALQFYSGNFMDGKDLGKRGDVHNYRTGIALEAQNYPDAPNHPNFPNSVLRPGETYTQKTTYGFSVMK